MYHVPVFFSGSAIASLLTITGIDLAQAAALGLALPHNRRMTQVPRYAVSQICGGIDDWRRWIGRGGTALFAQIGQSNRLAVNERLRRFQKSVTPNPSLRPGVARDLMQHEIPLISTIVAALVLAFVLGALAQRLRISPIVGYLVAGVAIGPFTPGYVADASLARELSELGIILLMFGVGLHFSLRDLLSVRAIAIPGAIAQIGVATLLGLGLALLLGWTFQAGFVFGLALSVASTVVLLRALQERHAIETERGRIAVGWLIVEDLVMVLALVIVPAIAVGDGALNGTFASPTASMALALVLTIGKVAAFILVVLFAGRRLIPWLLHYVAHTGSRELFRLAVLAIALGVAFGAASLFDVSFALGAFFAGVVMSESALSQQAANETLPLRDAFATLFFVSVGMLFDPSILLRDPWPLVATLFIIVLGKSAAAFLIVRAFGHPTSTALMISASLAQIGEFSFILAGLGVSLQILPSQANDLILAGAIFSIMLNPALFQGLDWLERKRREPPAKGTAQIKPVSKPVIMNEPLAVSTKAGHAIVIGHGRVGSVITQELTRRGIPFVIVQDEPTTVASLRARGIDTVAGNAADERTLAAANVAEARWLFVAIPNGFEAGQVIIHGKKINPRLHVVARAHSDEEVKHLQRHGADAIIMGERELAFGMIDALFGREPAEGDKLQRAQDAAVGTGGST